jgi:Ser/Thr protein kinase RdoA (MazF antagonist)
VIATLRSLPAPQALRAYLQHAYGFEVTSCTLLRSLINDIYEISTPERRLVLKLYRGGNWSIDEPLCRFRAVGCRLPRHR